MVSFFFLKAFNSIEHLFIFHCLKLFDFGDKCRKIILESLYLNSNSSVSLPGGTSHKISIKRGVKQGCPVPFRQMLSILIKNSNIAHLKVLGQSVTIGQFTDDATSS